MHTYRVATVMEYLEPKLKLDTSIPMHGTTSAIQAWIEKGWELFAIQSAPSGEYHLLTILTFRKESPDAV